jgi:hypothetical protein
MKTLQAIEPIWPDICKYEVISGGQLVGFSVKYFPGEKWTKITKNPKNMFTKTSAKVKLILKLKELI